MGVVEFLKIAFPLKPIGILRSCFSRRNGTPRQPLLVTAARAKLTLRPELGPEYLEGLSSFSHCWILYIFHENTDLQRLWASPTTTHPTQYLAPKGKIRVPRLNGKKIGVFSTRSPHRPCPIGLSVAQILAIDGNTVTVGGADIVDGSPVLDIKPYVPFCDAVFDAKTPAWVAPSVEQGDEPLAVGAVVVGDRAEEMLRSCWECTKSTLYSTFEDYKTLVVQVLSRDIRSVTQRVKVPKRKNTDADGVSSLQEYSRQKAGAGGEEEGTWHLELDGIDITYEVEDENDEKKKKVVRLKTARIVGA